MESICLIHFSSEHYHNYSTNKYFHKLAKNFNLMKVPGKKLTVNYFFSLNKTLLQLEIVIQKITAGRLLHYKLWSTPAIPGFQNDCFLTC